MGVLLKVCLWFALVLYLTMRLDQVRELNLLSLTLFLDINRIQTEGQQKTYHLKV